MSGQILPNLGNYELKKTEKPDWKPILKFFRGSELQNYFNKLKENKDFKPLIKVQYVDSISTDPKYSQLIVGKKLASLDNKGILSDVIEALDLEGIL